MKPGFWYPLACSGALICGGWLLVLDKWWGAIFAVIGLVAMIAWILSDD